MDGEAIVQSVLTDIIEPGVQRLMDSRYFTELRQGKLSLRRLQGWAIQHYLHNKAILKSFALGMVKNAHDQDLFDYYSYQFNEEQSHLIWRRGLGLPSGSTKKISPKQRKSSNVRSILRARFTTRCSVAAR